MKNIFKSLMLVAVAAMAFTACQKDNDETNKTEQKTVITGVATIENDDTRSTFLPKEDGETAYQSAWEGNETLKVYYNDTSYPGAILNSEGQFKAEIDGTLPDTYYITICSPADSWLSIYSPKIPTEQTPHVNSVDPAAHILQAQNVWVKNGSAEADLQHFIAYGKMTVSTPVAFDIDHVIVEFNGLKYDYDSTMSYRINADNVENNVFWFGCDILDVDNFIVTAYDAEGNSYSKTVENVTTLPKPLKFQQGRVSTFSISLTTYAEKPAEPTVPTYNAASISYSSGQDKIVNFTSNDVNLLPLAINFYGCFTIDSTGSVLNEGTYTMEWINSVGIYEGSYTNYNGTALYDITVTVSHVNGQYNIVIENAKNTYGDVLIEEAVFVGSIEGLVLPSTDPSMTLSTNSLTFKAAGDSKDVTVTTKNTNEAVMAEVTDSSVADQFTVTSNGNIVTITAKENTSEEGISATVTITCGALTETVSITQVGTSSSGRDGLTPETAYVFASYTTEWDSDGYPYLCLSGAENNAYLKLGSNYKTYYKTGLLDFCDDNWYVYGSEYKIDGVTKAIKTYESKTWLEGTDITGYTVKYIYIVTDDSALYYKYDDTIFIE